MNENPDEGHLESIVWLETILRQKAETLILNDGSRLHGIIVPENDGYLVFAPEGKKIVRFEDIADREF